MALTNGCTGQELITEINNMQESYAKYQEQTDAELNILEDDGFHIGDIRYSASSLGNNYLLCNGNTITELEYPDLVALINTSTGQTGTSVILPALSVEGGYVYIKAKEGDSNA